jgi:nitrate/nitrite transporter NarK
MYGYSYVKQTMKDFVFGSAAQNAYYVGFIGQYMAFIPGTIFDKFGPVVTIVYGAVMVALGFVMVGLSAMETINPTKNPIILYCGMFLAGQGSKGLGFGTMLGSAKASPDSMVGTISGVYLAFDALSGILCMYSYSWFFETPGAAGVQPMANFFVCMGVFIGVCGAITALVYQTKYVEYAKLVEESKPKDNETDMESEQQALIKPAEEDPAAEAKRNSLWEEASVTSFMSNGSQKKKEEKKEKQTFYVGVLCICCIMILGEAQGLAFNNNIPDSYMAAKRLTDGHSHQQHGDKKTTVFTVDQLFKSDDEVHHKQEFLLHKQVADYLSAPPRYMKINADKKGFTLTTDATGTEEKGKVTRAVDLTKEFHCNSCVVFVESDAAGVPLPGKEGVKLSDLMNAPVDILKYSLTDIQKSPALKKALADIGKVGIKKEKTTTKEGTDKWTFKVVYGDDGDNQVEKPIVLEDKDGNGIPDILETEEGTNLKLNLLLNDEKTGAGAPTEREMFEGRTVPLHAASFMGKELHSNIFRKYVTDMELIGTDKFQLKTTFKGGETYTFEDADADAHRFWDFRGVQDGEMKSFKKTLTMTFIIANAVGRLGFGITADMTSKQSPYLGSTFYILFCTVLYAICFGLFRFVGMFYESSAAFVATVFCVGLCYGGIFTLVTAYCKQVCAPSQVGTLLGCCLIVMAVGALIFGNFLAFKDEHHEHEISPNMHSRFFETALIGQAISFVIGLYVYGAQVAEAKEAMGLTDEKPKKGEETDDSGKEEEA